MGSYEVYEVRIENYMFFKNTNRRILADTMEKACDILKAEGEIIVDKQDYGKGLGGLIRICRY